MILLASRSRCSRRPTRSPWRRRSSARGTRAASVAAAAAGVAEARAALRVAGTIPNPTVSYSHSESTPRNHLLVDQPLDWLLRRGSDRSAAQAGVDRARWPTRRSPWPGCCATCGSRSTAPAPRGWRSRWCAAQAALADSVARLAAARLRAGDISLLEQEQAAQEAARARQTAAAAREAARVDEAELARAIAWEGRAADADGCARRRTWTSSPTPRSTLAALPGRAHRGGGLGGGRRPGAKRRPRARPAADAPVGRRMGRRGAARHARRHRDRGAVPAVEHRRGHGGRSARPARPGRRRSRARPGSTPCGSCGRPASISRRPPPGARFDRDSIVPGAAVLRARALRAYQAGETGIFPVLDALRGERDASLAALQDELAFQEALADWYALAGIRRVTRRLLSAGLVLLVACGTGGDGGAEERAAPARVPVALGTIARDSLVETLALTGRLEPRPGGSRAARGARGRRGARGARAGRRPRARGARSWSSSRCPSSRPTPRRRPPQRRRPSARRRASSSSWPTGSPRRGRPRRRPRTPRQAAAAAAAARDLLARTRVASPIAGRVQEVMVQPGERVDAGKRAGAGGGGRHPRPGRAGARGRARRASAPGCRSTSCRTATPRSPAAGSRRSPRASTPSPTPGEAVIRVPNRARPAASGRGGHGADPAGRPARRAGRSRLGDRARRRQHAWCSSWGRTRSRTRAPSSAGFAPAAGPRSGATCAPGERVVTTGAFGLRGRDARRADGRGRRIRAVRLTGLFLRHRAAVYLAVALLTLGRRVGALHAARRDLSGGDLPAHRRARAGRHVRGGAR